MKEYLIIVTSEITKHYMIYAASNEEAICAALDYFMDNTEKLDENTEKINNVRVQIKSIGEINKDELNEEN